MAEAKNWWKWASDGVVKGGRKLYSSIVRGQEVVKLRDTVFIRSHVPSNPYVAEILSFHENLTDGQACADVFWYFRPDELKSALCKIPAKNLPQLPPLGGNEVVMTNRRDGIQVSSIVGLAVIKKLPPTNKVSSFSCQGDAVVVRFSFDFLKKSLTSVEASSSLSLSDSSSGLESQPASESGSNGRVRHRTKGELRPVVSTRKSFSPTVAASPSALASGSNKKRYQYNDILGLHSPKFPGNSSPSLHYHQPDSPLLKSHTCSKVTTPTTSSNFDFDSLLTDSAARKRKASLVSPEYWVGKKSPKVRKLLDNTKSSPASKTLSSPRSESKSRQKVSVSGTKANLTGKKLGVVSSNSDSSGDSEDYSDESDYIDTPGVEEGHGDEEKKEEEEEWMPMSKTLRTPGNSRLLAGGTPKSSLRMTSAARGRVGRPPSSIVQELDCEAILTATPRKVHTVVIPERRVPAEGKRGGKRKANDREELLEQARERLHVSAVPDSLPCRDEEFSAICRFVEDHLQNTTGGCMYISGMPGVGKTALVREVARYLVGAVEEDMLPSFKFVEVNGMKVTAPPKIFVSIVMQLTGRQVSTDSALSFLKRYVVSDSNRTLLLVDEVDYLYTKKQKVLYELFSLPGVLKSKLILLVVTNTLDLHERVMKSSTTSRLGLTRVDFKPYTHQQLQEIVKSRLDGVKVFEPDAVELASRKLAAKCGDARRVLDVCRRAVEIASLEEVGSASTSKGRKAKEAWLVNMQHLQRAMDELCSLPMVNAIRRATLYQKKFLQALVALIHSTGQEETTMRDIYSQLKEIMAVEECGSMNFSQVLQVCSSLCSSNIVVVSNTKCDVSRKVKLVPNLEDVVFALHEH